MIVDNVFLPDSIDSETERQLDLFIWADAYNRIYNSEFSKLIKDLEKIDLDSPFYSQNEKNFWSHFRFRVINNTDEVVRKGTTLSWEKTREFIWNRDKGVCQVCLDCIDKKYYECGHIVDRVCGGSDRVSNLVVMCVTCNRLKSLTNTREEYIEWVKDFRQDKAEFYRRLQSAIESWCS